MTELSARDVDELFGLREVLERFAVQIAPPVPDPLALAELANRLDAMRRAAVTGAAVERAGSFTSPWWPWRATATFSSCTNPRCCPLVRW